MASRERGDCASLASSSTRRISSASRCSSGASRASSWRISGATCCFGRSTSSLRPSSRKVSVSSAISSAAARMRVTARSAGGGRSLTLPSRAAEPWITMLGVRSSWLAKRLNSCSRAKTALTSCLPASSASSISLSSCQGASGMKSA